MGNNNPPTKARPVRPGVFSRWQSYWQSSPSPATGGPLARPSVQGTRPQQPRFLKVKIVSWNMHDSLPKGDLEQLLGKVPSYQPSSFSDSQFPTLSNDDGHPYHLVVIAGQECPTLSGIPMGLSAGFKRFDKDKERDKVNGEKVDGRGKEPQNVQRLKSRRDREETRRKKDEDTHEPSGWTAMCEDWLCHGSGLGLRNGSPTIADVSFPKPLVRRVPSKDTRRGPYQLLTKERLMGIYLAIYIHRDIQNLVGGTSKSAVTAGLIGGRVGNKGGVGISLNLLDTTFLFLNAHLAAHGNKVNHRLSNLLKIKTELTVDPYLRHDDPRIMAEDLTDKFDFTFMCGDLNFRLDITRLHADWLISQRDYAKALHFDQLRNLMKEGKAFVGFNEGSINFPPTFKYDVLRTLKKPKRSSSKHGESHQTESPVFTSQEYLTQGDPGGDYGDIISIASTLSRSSSLNSGGEEGEISGTSPVTPTGTAANANNTSLKAVQNANKRWLTLLSTRLSPYRSKSPPEILPVNNDRKSLEETQRSNKSKPPTPVQRRSLDTGENRNLQPPTLLINSTKSSLQSDDRSLDLTRGIYDSSHKQRVPSWCDRILWKSTVVPDKKEDLIGDVSSRSKSGFVKRLTRALRSKSRSLSREILTPTSPTSSKQMNNPGSALSQGPQLISPSHVVQPPSSVVLVPSRSHENFQSQLSSSLGPQKQSQESRLRRATSPTTGAQSAHPPREKAARRGTEGHTPKRASSRDSFWRFFPSFLSPSHSPEASPKDSPIDSSPQDDPQPQKGDVICISYGTLDDCGMRKLEGRSDHRPVVGSYAVYF